VVSREVNAAGPEVEPAARAPARKETDGGRAKPVNLCAAADGYHQ